MSSQVGGHRYIVARTLLGWRPILLQEATRLEAIATRFLLLGWRPSLVGWRPLLLGVLTDLQNLPPTLRFPTDLQDGT